MTDQRLFELACQALKNAYAPYSKFKVGACVLSADGRTFTGCNVENASYGATICGERSAATRAVSEGVTRFTAIAVATERQIGWPCGICRQVLHEFSDDMRVISGNAATGEFVSVPLTELLPRAFGPRDLEDL